MGQSAGVGDSNNIMGLVAKIFGMKAALFLISWIQVAWTHPTHGIGDVYSGVDVLPDPGLLDPVNDNFLDSINKYNKKPDIVQPVQTALSCASESLQCVPKLDCEDDPLKGTRQCPPMWEKIGGACYFVPSASRVRERTQPEARQYCKDLGGHLVWFENEYEKKAVKEAIDHIPFWTDGVYNKKQDHWYWEHNWLEIVFKKLDGGVSKDDPLLIDPRDQRLCLSVNETGFTTDTCYEQKSFVCKMGNFDNRCEKTLGRCCWGPSYGYYYKHLHGSTLSTNLDHATKGYCFVLFNGEIVKCEKAFEELKNLPTFRIGKSIYYLNSADEGCSGSREAVIANEDINLTIVRFLMTVERLNIKIKIGLTIKATDTGSTLLWVNGKSVDYYKNVFWATGHPKMHGLSGCVMYTGTSSDGSGPYLWMTIADDDECTKTNNMVLCELNIRNTDFEPEKKKESCGIRHSGGVLGRSFSNGNDHEEARFGEWPWQAAILNTRNFNHGVGQEFACSGVLLSRDVVLTSAHCVRGLSTRALLVSLGDYDLEAVNRRKLLKPLTFEVQAIVIHQDYTRGKNDLAILHLATSVSYLDHPHINVGCLPSQSILYAGGDWECFVTGWPQSEHSAYHASQRRLQRIEVEFVSRRLCQRQTRRDLYDVYGRLINPYGARRSNSINNWKKDPELLCVEPWDSTTCLADSTMMLVCKKNSVYNDDPFNLGDAEDSGSSYGQSQQPGIPVQGNIQSYSSESTKVINAYGKNRFNADKWYVIGVGHESNSCRQSGYMVFTPVHEYLSFVHTLIDESINV